MCVIQYYPITPLPLKIQYYVVNSYKEHQTSQHFAGMLAKGIFRRFDIFVTKRKS